MQVVDVLGDHGGNLAGPIQAGQRAVAPSRPGIAELVGHGEATPPGFVARFLARHELIERNRPVLGPQPAGRTEVGYAAFGGDAGPGERHGNLGIADEVD